MEECKKIHHSTNCVVKCLLEKQGIIKEGAIQEDLVLKLYNLTTDHMVITERELEKCRSKFKNSCDGVVKYSNCIAQEMLETLNKAEQN